MMSRTIIYLAGFSLVAIIFYVIGHSRGNSLAMSRMMVSFSKNVSGAAVHEAVLIRDLVARDQQNPITQGDYRYEITADGKPRVFSVSITEDNGVFYLLDPASENRTKISEDGQYFDWEGRGYGVNRHIGRVINDSIKGRTFYSHGGDIGVEHFTIRPD